MVQVDVLSCAVMLNRVFLGCSLAVRRSPQGYLGLQMLVVGNRSQRAENQIGGRGEKGEEVI